MRPVFIHISKNAGTSIVASAGGQIQNAGHHLASWWLSRNGAGGPLFAVVRHPYDRALSEFRYRRRRFLSGEQNPHLSNLDLPVDAWIEATYRRGDFRTQEFFERTGTPFNDHNMIDGCLIWFLSQKRWLVDAEGNLLTDELLRFESLESDWQSFADRHGIAAGLSHLNAASAAANPFSLLADESRDILYNYFKDDFETFGYQP